MDVVLSKGENLRIIYKENCPCCGKTFNSKARKKTKHHVLPKFMKSECEIIITICKECHEELNSHYDNNAIIRSKTKGRDIKEKPESFEDFLENYKTLRTEFYKKTKGKAQTANGKFGEGLWTNLVNYLEVISIKCDANCEGGENAWI